MAGLLARQQSLVRQPFQGLNRALSTEDLTPKGSSVARCHFELGYIHKKLGRTAIGGTDTVPLNLELRQLATFNKLNGVQRIMAFTQTEVYSWSYNATNWDGRTGSATLHNNLVSSTTYVNKFYFSNDDSRDDVYYWDYTDTSITALAAGYKGKILANYGERLIMMNTWEGSAWQGQRFRWSNVGNTTFSSDDYVDLVSYLGDDEIIGCAQLQSSLIIYGRRHILECSYTGSTTTPFAFTLRDTHLGLNSLKGLFATKSIHYFLSAEGLHVFDLSLSAKPIDAPVRDWFLANCNKNRWTDFVVTRDQRTNQLLLYYTSSGGTANDKVLCMDMSTGAWTEDDRTCECATYAGPTGQLTIDELSGTIDALSGDLDHLGMSTINLRTFVGDTSGTVWWDFNGSNQGSSAEVLDYETKDFTFEDDGGTCWMSIEFLAKGNHVTVSYSTDEGTTWTSLTETDLTSSWTRYRLDFESVGKSCRFRFYNNTASEDAYLRWFRPYFLRTNAWGTLPT